MTRDEFLNTISYLTAAIGKPIAEGHGEEGRHARNARLDVYFDLLGELPADVFLSAAKRVACEHVWATFPSVAELRQAAGETIQGEIKRLSPSEAWEKAWGAIKRIDPEIEGSINRECAKLPALVIEAMKIFPLVSLCYAKPEFARPQFMKIYEGILAREIRHAILPPSVKNMILAIGQRNAIESSQTLAAIESIGKEQP